MAYRDNLAALAARKAALEAELAAKTRERDEVGAMLDEAQQEQRHIDELIATAKRRRRHGAIAAVACFGVVIGGATALSLNRSAAKQPPRPPPIADTIHPDFFKVSPPMQDCDPAAMQRAIAAENALAQEMLPKLFGKARATPGVLFDQVKFGVPLSDATDQHIDGLLRGAGMSWRAEIKDDQLVGYRIQVGNYDPTYPGTCDPAGPCECIGPGDDRERCSELRHLLERTWGKPTRAPHAMFSFASNSDDAIWRTTGREARLSAYCELVF